MQISLQNMFLMGKALSHNYSLLFQTKNFIIIMIATKYLKRVQKYCYQFTSAKFKYNKQLAQTLKIQMPPINQDLGIQANQKCWLLGFRKIIKVLPQPQNNEQADIECVMEEQIQYIEDPLNREELCFAQISRLADEKGLDICFSDEENKEVELTNISQKIYRKYYFSHIFKRNSTAKKFKQIRIPQKIQDHDLKNKAEKIKNMIKKGDYKFRIVTENQSETCQKNIGKFCQSLGKQNAAINLEEEVLQQKIGRKKKIVTERFVTLLDFQKQVEVDYQKVNKKWKRKNIDEKVKAKMGQRKEESPLDTLIQRPVAMQRQILATLKKANIPYPKGYEAFQRAQKALQQGYGAFFQLALEKYKKQIEQTARAREAQAAGQNSSDTSDFNSNYSESQTQISDKDQRKYLGMRTVDDILNDMEELRKGRHELDQVEAYQMKKLEDQLKMTLRLGGYKGDI